MSKGWGAVTALVDTGASLSAINPKDRPNEKRRYGHRNERVRGPEAFTVRPEDFQVDINRTKNDITEMFTFSINREDNLRAFRMEGDDVLEDEDLFGVPPQSEGKEVIGKKTWRNALGGHRGHEAVYFDLSQRFYWNGMYADVKAYIRIATHADKPNTQIPRGKTA